MKRKTESLRQRYEGYASAGHVLLEFEADLKSPYVQKTDLRLKRLGLPTLPDIKDEFLALAGRMDVERERPPSRRHRLHLPHPWHRKKPEAGEKAWR